MKTVNDSEILVRLAKRLNRRTHRASRRARPVEFATATVGEFRSGTARVCRDPLAVAQRYLRRFAGGDWCRVGNHVSRLDFGLALCFGHGRFYADRLGPVGAE